MKSSLRTLSLAVTAGLVAMGAQAASWNTVATSGFSAFSMFLCTDGRLLVGSEYSGSANWYFLTPSSTGSYTSGATWTTAATSPTNRLYYGCAILADGRIPMFGGEYLNLSAVWTNKCDIFNPATNTWTTLTPPAGASWSQIGDATSQVLADGRFYFGNAFNTASEFFNPSTNTFTAGPTLLDRSNEEGWTPTWNDSLIVPDAFSSRRSERYNPDTNSWAFDTNLPVDIYTASSFEPGGGVTLMDGRVFHTGGRGQNALYTPGATSGSNGTWVAAASFPSISGVQQGAEDGQVCLLPNGLVMCSANKASSFTAPTHLYLFNPTTNTMTQIADPVSWASNPCYTFHFIVLPTGQIAVSYSSGQLLIYTPDTAGINDSWRPYSIITPPVCAANDDILVFGEQINGLSQGANYGDEGIFNTNFPLVRLTNTSTGVVTYARTHDHSTMAIGPNHQRQYTNAKIPAGLANGTYNIEVIANGLAQKTPNSISINSNRNFISGTITFENFTNRAEEPGFWTTMQLVNASTNVVAETQSVHTTDVVNGRYQFLTTKTGTYYLRAQTGHWLSQRSPNFTIIGNTFITQNFSLDNGDIDRDNVISVFDYGILSDYFDKDETDADWFTFGGNGWRPYDADLDGDGHVSVFDYGIISTNWDKSGT